jgi:hypothetical protein
MREFRLFYNTTGNCLFPNNNFNNNNCENVVVVGWKSHEAKPRHAADTRLAYV